MFRRRSYHRRQSHQLRGATRVRNAAGPTATRNIRSPTRPWRHLEALLRTDRSATRHNDSERHPRSWPIRSLLSRIRIRRPLRCKYRWRRVVSRAHLDRSAALHRRHTSSQVCSSELCVVMLKSMLASNLKKTDIRIA